MLEGVKIVLKATELGGYKKRKETTPTTKGNSFITFLSVWIFKRADTSLES